MAHKILVIEDDSDVVELVRSNLETAGYKVSVCTAGSNALRMVEEANPDLIILDMMLPGVDGHTLVTKMAQDENKKNIPVIIMTVLANTKEMFFKFSQVVGFVTKPFDITELLEKVQNVLKDSGLKK